MTNVKYKNITKNWEGSLKLILCLASIWNSDCKVERAENNDCAIRGNDWDIKWNSNIQIQLHMCLDIR